MRRPGDEVYPEKPEAIHLDPTNPKSCRLCGVLLDKWWSKSSTLDLLGVEYWLSIRKGYFIAVRDIVFKPIGGSGSGPQTARFGLQLAKDNDVGRCFLLEFYATRSPSQETQKRLDTTAFYPLLLT